MTSLLDAAREQNPDLGFALYAFDPGGPLTLEIITPAGDTFSWSGPNEEAVFALAFPPVEIVETEERQQPTIDIFE